LAPEPLAEVDRWIAKQKEPPSRPEAIRWLLSIALKTESGLAHSIVELGPKAKR
jgi:hypothetical protein